MTTNIVKVSRSQEREQRQRKGFIPIEQYGNLTPLKKEIGGIFKNFGVARIIEIDGIFVATNLQCVERIVIY